jgi:isoleucyl-tRNA synthetase
VIVFEELTAEANLTRIEEQVRRFWRRHEVPAAFRAARRDGPAYVLYQQPLGAAGQSPAAQVRLLATADLVARYRAMKGDAVHRQVGWTGHGLPVEVGVERTLGADVAGYDLARFNAACRQTAVEGKRQGAALAERLGVWLAADGTYDTLSPQAIGAVWGALRRLWAAGRLNYDHRVVPFCSRCATPLSEAEAARRSIEVETRSIWLRLPWDGEANAYVLVWTPQPWTLVGMVALAAHPDVSYILVELTGDQAHPPARLLLSEPALNRTLNETYKIVRRLSGKALSGTHCHLPFTFLPAGTGAGCMVLSRDVPLDRGTGLLPVTPTFDMLSLTLAQDRDLPVPHFLDDWGGLGDSITPWQGLSPLDAEPLLVEDVRARGLLFREQSAAGQRVLCPHCETPLLPLDWSVWLVEMGDEPWIVGRDRAWGAPLPLWICERCGEELCVAGLDDLAHRTGLDADQIEPHRPAVDRLTFACETCGGTMHRVAAVIDAAFEAAVLPVATATHPIPADLAIGLGDRDRGWLGDLTGLAGLMHDSPAWQQAMALAEGMPETGWSLERVTPADALRWAAYTGTTPERAEHEFLRPLWQVFVALHEPPPVMETEAVPPSGECRDLFDRWLLARLYQATGAVSQALEIGKPGRAAGELAALVSDLGDWYVPHHPGGDSQVLATLSQLLAPFVPHLAEAIHRQAKGRAAPSVHLTAWPVPDLTAEDREFLACMAQVRCLAALGQIIRTQAGVEPNQLLPQAIVSLLAADDGGAASLAAFKNLVAEVVGVSQVQFVRGAAAPVEWRLALNPELVVGWDTSPAEVEAALAHLSPEEAASLVSQIGQGLSVSLEVPGPALTLLPDQVRISARAQPGWAAASDGDHLVIVKVG